MKLQKKNNINNGNQVRKEDQSRGIKIDTGTNKDKDEKSKNTNCCGK